VPAEGEYWVHELVGATVVDRAGADLGRVVAVEDNPAHDLLVLDGGALVPMVFLVEHRDGRVVVDVPDGLFDL
jgi:16S rRNA processing protein RimM